VSGSSHLILIITLRGLVPRIERLSLGMTCH
jgi:hypothetical protein